MLSLLLLALTASVSHADSLDCELARDGGRFALSSAVADGQAEAQTAGDNPLHLALDASLGSSTYFTVLDDPQSGHHVAFSGSSLTISPDGARLSLGSSAAALCRQNAAAPAFAPPALPEHPDYFVCMLDEAHFAKGEIDGNKRHAFKVTSALERHLPVEVTASDADTSFHVRYVSFDPFHGLDITLTDRASGEVARFSGPARAMVSSFMMGVTLGDRAADARLLRLACIWTDDPSKFKATP